MTATEDDANAWDRLLDALAELTTAVSDLWLAADECRSVDPPPEVGSAAFEAAFAREVEAQQNVAMLAALLRPM